MAERSLPAFVVAGLIVVGSLVAAAVLSSPSGFLGGTRGAENQSTDGLASSTPTPDAWGGSVVGTLPVGNQPYGVGYDSGNGYVYVANYNSNNVSVINGTTVVASVVVGNNPFGVGYDIGNGYVYVANGGSDTVSVINGTTVVATVLVGNAPSGVAYDSGNGYIYVANNGANTVSVIATTRPPGPLFLVTFIETGLPSGTSWSVTLDDLLNRSTTPTITFSGPNGTYSFAVGRIRGDTAYYYAIPASGSLAVNGTPVSVPVSFTADTRGGTVVATVPTGTYPLAVAYDSGNGYIYVTNQYSNNVSVISGTTVVATIPVGNMPYGVAYEVGKGHVYVANYDSNNVSVIDGTTVVASVAVGAYLFGVAYDDGNGYVYVANTGSNTMSVITGTAPRA